MNKQNHRCRLMLSGEQLEELKHTGLDMFWIYGNFHPPPAFEKYRELFERLELSWEEESDYEATDFLEVVNNLNLAIEDEEGRLRPIRDFKISEGQFEYKII